MLANTDEVVQEEIAQLRRAVDRLAAENLELRSALRASAREAAGLRLVVAELRNSLSWKVTAPLRFVSKPLFRLLRPARPARGAWSEETGEASSPAMEQARLALLLAELRRAQSLTIITSPIPYQEEVNQRCISCARHLADAGTTVLFVAWQWSPQDAVPRAWEQVRPRVFQIPLYAFLHFVEAVAAVAPARRFYVCSLPSDDLVQAARPLRAKGYHIHYDIVDDWEEFHRVGQAPWFRAEMEQSFLLLADSVTAVSTPLAGKFAHLRGDIAIVRNGYDPTVLDCPQFVAARSQRRDARIVGYFGHLTEAWFDWDTVLEAARQLPDVTFELIGYGLPEQYRSLLQDFPNLRFCGLIPQNRLHMHVKRWWAGMIPFRPSALAAAVDPLKIYEYLHFGLPTVVTGITGVAGYPLVHYAGSRADFVETLKRLPDRLSERLLDETKAFLEDCVWEKRCALLINSMSDRAALPHLYAS